MVGSRKLSFLDMGVKSGDVPFDSLRGWTLTSCWEMAVVVSEPARQSERYCPRALNLLWALNSLGQ